MSSTVKRALRRTGSAAGAAVAAAAMVVGAAAPASAADYYYELPYPAGEAYEVTQGPEGTYSHTGPYNEYA